ncbi:allantoinase-like [Danaus plexippus]|uniref:allantoinase-like n=1 Tax=Danaus plexippus TaxID=13037 RepID=UPI002AAF5515|nr:allantoinase-like [Danaus plexippus]
MTGQYNLFLSKRLVTEEKIFDGGVLVNEFGKIEDVLDRYDADNLIAESKDKITVVDGGDCPLLAGVVDSHVHVNEPGRTAWEGFRTATSAAAAGGITTIVDMPLNSIPPTTTLENLKIKANSAKENVFVDVGFWGGVIVGNQDSLRDLIKAGVVGFKCFLCPSGVEEFPNVGIEDLNLAFDALEGTGSVLAFHAEVEEETSSGKCMKLDPEDYNTYLESRPSQMELSAVSLITNFLQKTDVRVHIVHVSSANVVPLLVKAREDRLAKGHNAWRGGVTAETCHHYLTLSADEVPRGHSEYKCAPPIRDANNKEKLWKFLLDDKLDMVVSDHSPCTPELKCSNNLKAWGGISSVQFGLPLFWTQASARGLDLRSITKYLSSGPAHLCGLQNRKGALKKGLDADLIFFDCDANFTVTQEIIRHKNKLTPYIGKELKGVVRKTYLRGHLIYDGGDLIGSPRGELLLNDIK